MFEEPPTKRIRRDELFAGSSTPSSRSASPLISPSSDDTHGNASITHAPREIGYGFEYDIIDTSNTAEAISRTHGPGNGTKASSTARQPVRPTALDSVPQFTGRVSSIADDLKPNEEDDGLEFRLFASAKDDMMAPAKPEQEHRILTPGKPATSRLQRIRIRSPTPLGNADGGGFVDPHRSREYYFTFEAADDTTEIKKQQYRSVAISGIEVGQLATLKWYGSALPWRVLHIPSSSQQRPANSLSSTEISSIEREGRARRARPGKKRRIILRKRQAGQSAAELADREKKTRRNREKKVKKKMRDKGKKEAERQTNGMIGVESVVSD